MKSVQIRAFRAVDDPESCEKFIRGHRRVLELIGIKEVTSSKNEWKDNPAAFVIIVESPDGEKVYGGARIHAADGTSALPLEEATGELDASIFDIVKAAAATGTGEVCGLWNSREVAGMGIGSVFLIRSCVVIAKYIGLSSLFALCASYTVKLAESVGYEVETGIGNDGCFYYPKEDLIATITRLKDVDTLSKANDFDRKRIFSLRENPDQFAEEPLRSNIIRIQYELNLKGVDRDEFKLGL